jgi:hypothetical protein
MSERDECDMIDKIDQFAAKGAPRAKPDRRAGKATTAQCTRRFPIVTIARSAINKLQ